ncbi:hypothetical protein AG0111_0g7249 [Alternaria gaisen]|uniref:Uncharacterized protein n=1 Tax=Alternaria gaisen TaxID=167740 RepID=A0ACB6FI11_9PLEO|nr:hypothetical protein AG0111_0g7249 [Alternaria gaisen]
MTWTLRNLPELWSMIKTQMTEVAEYEQAIARLGDTIDDECMSTMKARHRILQTELEENGKLFKTMATWSHPRCLPEDSSLTVISITELSQAISAEAKALEDVTTIHLSLVKLTTNRAGLEQELRNIRRAKERARTEPINSMDGMEDDNEIQNLDSSIEGYAGKIREHESLIISLHQKASVAMRAANRATKSDIEVYGFGRWTPISAPTTVTTASDVVLAAPITVSTAQVKVADIPPEVKAAAKDLQASTALDVVATVSRSTTATIKVDKTLSSITLCAPQKQYANVKSVEQK